MKLTNQIKSCKFCNLEALKRLICYSKYKKFKPGDRVRSKSGDPVIVVKWTSRDKNFGYALWLRDPKIPGEAWPHCPYYFKKVDNE